MKNRYALEILWSNQDDGYIAVCPEFSDLCAFGKTREAALLEAQIALEQTIITYFKSTGKAYFFQISKLGFPVFAPLIK